MEKAKKLPKKEHAPKFDDLVVIYKARGLEAGHEAISHTEVVKDLAVLGEVLGFLGTQVMGWTIDRHRTCKYHKHYGKHRGASAALRPTKIVIELAVSVERFGAWLR